MHILFLFIRRQVLSAQPAPKYAESTGDYVIA